MKKSNLIAIILTVVAGAFGIALMTHLANTTQQPTKNQSVKTDRTKTSQNSSTPQKPQIRKANSSPILLKSLNEYHRTSEDLKRSIEDLEITQYTQEDHYSAHEKGENLVIKYIPQLGTEPHKIIAPLGMGGGAFEYSVLNRYVEYRATVNPELLSDKSRQDLAKMDWISLIPEKLKPELEAETIEAKFGIACSRLNGRIIGKNVFKDCQKIINRKSFNCEPTPPEVRYMCTNDILLLSDTLQ